MNKKEEDNLYGVFYMLLHAASISTLYATVKFLAQDLSSNLIVFFYKFSILVCIIPWVFKDGLEGIKTPNIKLHIIRGFFSVCGSLCFMYGLKHVDIADATAVAYLEQILWALIGVMYFKEKNTKTKKCVAFGSFLGALIVIYPNIFELNEENFPVIFTKIGISEFNPHFAFILLAVFFWATNSTLVKILGERKAKNKTQVFYVMLFSSIFAYPAAFIEWSTIEMHGFMEDFRIVLPTRHIGWDEIPLELWHFKYIAIMALCYFVHTVSFFKSLQRAEMSAVAPFDYTKLLFTGIFGYVFFNETPEYGSYAGYLLITFCGIILIRSEARKRKKQKAQKESLSES